MTATIRLQREPFDAASEAAKLRRGRGDIGAVVTFTGICRSDENGAPLVALTLEHYPDMAEAEIARHVEEVNRSLAEEGAMARAQIRRFVDIGSERRDEMRRRRHRADDNMAGLDIADITIEQRLAPDIAAGLVEDEHPLAVMGEGDGLGPPLRHDGLASGGRARDEALRAARGHAAAQDLLMVRDHLGDLPLKHVWIDGLLLALILAFLVRPAAIALLLAPIRLRRGERLFVMWGGLKGAVPILLAAFALEEGVDQANRIYLIVFVVVIFSVVVQGSLIEVVARRLGVPIVDAERR